RSGRKRIGPTAARNGSTPATWDEGTAMREEADRPRLSLPMSGAPETAAARPSPLLTDSFGRVHNNLRVSVTDRCNLRCSYCMDEEVVSMDGGELLPFEEITRFVRAVVPLGIDKVRLTGGEPLMRRDLPRLVRMLYQVEGIRDVGLTTNGILLAEHAQ